MNIQFILSSVVSSFFNNEESVVIKGKIMINLSIEKQFELRGNFYEGWDLWLDDKLIQRMPIFDYRQSYAPFKWMIGFLNA
jgi:hypothetical protein